LHREPEKTRSAGAIGVVYLKGLIELLKEAATGWSRDRGSLLAAALAYYTTLSLAPLLVIAIGVAGLIYGEAAVAGLIVGQLEGVVGREIAQVLQLIIENAADYSSTGVLTTIVGVVLLFVAASGVFGHLKTALNMILGIVPEPQRGLSSWLKRRLLSFALALGIGLLLLVSVASSVTLAALRRYLSHLSPALVETVPRLDLLASLVVITVLFAIIFRVLPDAEVAWRDVWLGALATSLFFAIGEYVIGFYLANTSLGSAYGAAGTLVVVLTWIYYSAAIVMFGAEFTQAYANKFGSKIVPLGNARLVNAPTPRPSEPPLAEAWRAGFETQPVPQRAQKMRQVAAGMIGLAIGLLLALVSSRRRKE
jgi:membrane protein